MTLGACPNKALCCGLSYALHLVFVQLRLSTSLWWISSQGPTEGPRPGIAFGPYPTTTMRWAMGNTLRGVAG